MKIEKLDLIYLCSVFSNLTPVARMLGHPEASWFTKYEFNHVVKRLNAPLAFPPQLM